MPASNQGLPTSFMREIVSSHLEGEAREIIRQIQQARKEAGCQLSEKITVSLPSWPQEFEEQIKKETLSEKLIKSSEFAIKRAS